MEVLSDRAKRAAVFRFGGRERFGGKSGRLSPVGANSQRKPKEDVSDYKAREYLAGLCVVDNKARMKTDGDSDGLTVRCRGVKMSIT